jgi:hypothetical protein
MQYALLIKEKFMDFLARVAEAFIGFLVDVAMAFLNPEPRLTW